MLITILSLILFLTFCVLSGFHFYWVLGGTWGSTKVFPTKSGAARTYKIPTVATLVVAVGLLSIGLLYLIKSGLIHIDLPTWLTAYVYWIIPAVFILRAIGEFNYVGFFKKIKDTEFAEADTKIFAPLCLGIGVIGILIQLLK